MPVCHIVAHKGMGLRVMGNYMAYWHEVYTNTYVCSVIHVSRCEMSHILAWSPATVCVTLDIGNSCYSQLTALKKDVH